MRFFFLLGYSLLALFFIVISIIAALSIIGYGTFGTRATRLKMRCILYDAFLFLSSLVLARALVRRFSGV
jgi:hypothetical protein